MPINFRTQSPPQLAERMFCIQYVKEIGVGKIEALGEKYKHFLQPIVEDEGTAYNEIDWEFCLFEATFHQFDMLLENFIAKPKEEEEVKKPPLIIT